MANYLLLYSGGEMPQSEAEQQEVINEWTAWMGMLGSDLVDGGNPFTPMVKHMGSDGHVGDGPEGSMASGYSVIKADSLDAAVRKAQSCPVIKGGATITVYETFNAMGGM
jgi:hypothetical protein